MKRIFIEQETLDLAQQQTEETRDRVKEEIQNGTPDSIKNAIREHLEALRRQRAFITAHYNL